MEESETNYLKASFIDRFVAFIIDELVLIIPAIILNIILGSVFPKINSGGGAFQLVFSVVGIVYNIWLVTWRGATIGKKASKIKVVTVLYKNPTLGKVILRETIGKWLSGILNLGYLWILIDKKRQSWHDKIAGTFVIKVDKNGQPIAGEDEPITKKAYVLFVTLLLVFGLPIFLAILVLFYLFIASPNQVSSQAMAPNYQEGQFWIVNKITYKVSEPKRGDVIVFKAPPKPDIDYFKRIVGLPGEEIKIQNGKVYVNGQVLTEPYLTPDVSTRVENFMQEGVPVVVPNNSYFVLGDNRDHSSDSREWGFVPRESVIGEFWFRYH